MAVYYRAYKITFNPKPIPDRRHDWDFEHEDYDGAPDSGDTRAGSAETIWDCLQAINGIEEALREDEHVRDKDD